MKNTKDEKYQKLLDLGVSEQTLRVACALCGYSEDTLSSVLYVVYGYQSFDQMDEEDEFLKKCANYGFGYEGIPGVVAKLSTPWSPTSIFEKHYNQAE